MRVKQTENSASWTCFSLLSSISELCQKVYTVVKNIFKTIVDFCCCCRTSNVSSGSKEVTKYPTPSHKEAEEDTSDGDVSTEEYDSDELLSEVE